MTDTVRVSIHNRYYANKRQTTLIGQSKMNNQDKLATQGTQDKEKQNKNTTQYVLDTTTICKQTQIT